MKKLNIFLAVWFIVLWTVGVLSCFALGNDPLIVSIRQYAKEQNVTVQWINSKTDLEIYQSLDSYFNFTQAQTDRLKNRNVRFGLRGLLIEDAKNRAKKQRVSAVYNRLQALYPNVRVQERSYGEDDEITYYIVRIDGGDPNEIP